MFTLRKFQGCGGGADTTTRRSAMLIPTMNLLMIRWGLTLKYIKRMPQQFIGGLPVIAMASSGMRSDRKRNDGNCTPSCSVAASERRERRNLQSTEGYPVTWTTGREERGRRPAGPQKGRNFALKTIGLQVIRELGGDSLTVPRVQKWHAAVAPESALRRILSLFGSHPASTERHWRQT